MHALVRCQGVWGYQKVSSNSCGEGYTSQGVYGYVYSAPITGTRPLNRRYLGSIFGVLDYLVTTSATEGLSLGYVNESVLGYVP